MYWIKSWGWWTRYLYWIMYWILFYACWLRRLSAFVSSHLMSFHFLPFHLLSPVMSLENEMDQYLNVDQWQEKPEKESKEEDEAESKEKPWEYECLNHLASSVSPLWASVLNQSMFLMFARYLPAQGFWSWNLPMHFKRDGNSPIFGLASATKRGGLYRAIFLIILGIKAFMTFGAYPCKPAAKNQLTWSMFWCFRRVVNKVSPCQMTCFLFLILGDYPYKAVATNQWTWWISWWFRSVVNKLSMSNW